MFLSIILIFLGCVLLSRITSYLTQNLSHLARLLGLSSFAITAFLLALATSLPEVSVAITASFAGNSGLALGSALGSNIANFSLILGLTTLVGAPILISGDLRAHRLLPTVLLSLSPIILILDGSLGRLDAFILLLAYALYTWETTFRHATISIPKKSLPKNQAKILTSLAKILILTLLLVASAEFTVHWAKSLATILNLPPLFIGLFIVSVGTSLPELAFELKAIRKNQTAMAFGDLIGSAVTNATLVIGLAALIRPITLTYPFPTIQAGVQYSVILILFFLFTHSKHRLDRSEGFILTAFFFYFVILELWIN